MHLNKYFVNLPLSVFIHYVFEGLQCTSKWDKEMIDNLYWWQPQDLQEADWLLEDVWKLTLHTWSAGLRAHETELAVWPSSHPDWGGSWPKTVDWALCCSAHTFCYSLLMSHCLTGHLLHTAAQQTLSLMQHKLQLLPGSYTIAVLSHLLFMQWHQYFQMNSSTLWTNSEHLALSKDLSPKCISLNSGGKPVDQERNHAGTGKTCKLRKALVPVRDLAVRWHC